MKNQLLERQLLSVTDVFVQKLYYGYAGSLTRYGYVWLLMVLCMCSLSGLFVHNTILHGFYILSGNFKHRNKITNSYSWKPAYAIQSSDQTDNQRPLRTGSCNGKFYRETFCRRSFWSNNTSVKKYFTVRTFRRCTSRRYLVFFISIK